MALIVEDGTAKADAESYVSTADAIAYWGTRADAAFGAADIVVQEAALRRATQFLDVQWGDRFVSNKQTEAQALEWPRADLSSPSVTAGVIPTRVIQAICELAKIALAGPLAGEGATSPSPASGDLQSVSAGSVSVAWRDDPSRGSLHKHHADKFYFVEKLLAPVLSGSGSGLNTGLVRA